MNKPLTVKELEQVQVLSRKEKLIRWSMLVETHPTQCRMMHDLEYLTTSELRRLSATGTIFEIAGKDPVLMSAGLAGGGVLDCKEFFDLSKEDLHLIGCDCMGIVDNEEVSKRIIHISNR